MAMYAGVHVGRDPDSRLRNSHCTLLLVSNSAFNTTINTTKGNSHYWPTIVGLKFY